MVDNNAHVVEFSAAYRRSVGASERVIPNRTARKAAPVDTDMRPARGFVNGVFVAVPLWCVIGLLTWLWL